LLAERDLRVVEFKRINRSNHLLTYQLIFVVKYRKDLLKIYGEEVKGDLESIRGKSKFRIRNLETDQDHVNLIVESVPSLSPEQIVRRLRVGSTSLLW
jgi:REP element-mobilizing transposase RayT